MSAVGVPDIVLALIVLGFFALGFGLGMLDVGRLPGITLLSLTGGLAVGVRVVVVRDRLLVQDEDLFFVNWLVVAVMGVAGGLVVVWSRRVGIVSGRRRLPSPCD